jgi:signal transduction histidine kinase
MKYFLLICFILFFENTYGSSLDSLMIELSKSKLDTNRVKIYHQLASQYHKKSMIDSSLKYSVRGLETAITINWEYGMAENYEIMGLAYISNGQYYLASEKYFKALSIREKLNNKYKLGIINRKIGDCYSVLMETQKALVFYQKALPLLQEDKALYQKMVCYHNMGNNYKRAKQYYKALDMYKLSLPIYKKIDPIKGVSDPYEEMGVCYSKLGDFKKAEYYLLESYRLSNLLIDEENFKSHVLNQLTGMFANFKKHDKCILYGKRSLVLAESIKMNAHISETSQALYESYKATNKPEEALFYHEKMFTHKQLMDKAEHDKSLQSLNLEYRFDKEKQNSKFQELEINKQKKQNQLLLFGLIGFLVFSGVLIFLIQKINKQNAVISKIKNDLEIFNLDLEEKVASRTKELSEANSQLETMNEEIISSLLRGQTIERKRVASELHDNLGGQITAIRWSLMALEDVHFSEKESKIYQKIKQLTEKTYNEVRNISHNLLPEEFEKNGLEGALKKVMANMNSNEKIKFSLDIHEYPNLSKSVEFEIYSIVFELITNTIKHSNGTEAKMKLYQDSSKNAIIEYYDNGIGFDFDKVSKGNGLKNIQDRANSIGATFDYHKSFKLKTLPQIAFSPA